jgi:ParB-like chromosome segregation protein Spo0J
MPKLNTSISTTTDVATRRQVSFAAIGNLIPDPQNPRKHGRAQISAIAKSIEAFGFNAPILVDGNNKIVAGHGRYEAALLLGIETVPAILLDHLTPTQARAYRLADNKLSVRSTWDDVWCLASALNRATDQAQSPVIPPPKSSAEKAPIERVKLTATNQIDNCLFDVRRADEEYSVMGMLCRSTRN